MIRSGRRSISVEITLDAKVRVRAPRMVSNLRIELFLRARQEWIDAHAALMKKRIAAGEAKLPCGSVPVKWTEQELKDMKKRARQDLCARLEYYAPLVGVTYETVSIRAQRTRWGSCSGKGNISLNCLLMMLPEFVRDYVVVHELCHRKEMNHSPRFWTEVAKVCPDYKKAKKILKEQGTALIARL